MNIDGNLPTALRPPRLQSLTTRWAVWIGLAVLLYLLRSFFLLIFLTFVFAYIQSHFVVRLQRYSLLRNRTVRSVLVGLLFLGLIVALGSFLLPRVRQEAEQFARNYGNSMRSADRALVALQESYPLLEPYISVHSPGVTPVDSDRWSAATSPTVQLLQKFFGDESAATGSSDAALKQAVAVIRSASAAVVAAVSAFLLAVLFSFLIVLDLPGLTASIKRLSHSRIGFIYDEVGHSIVEFGEVLGRALEAQLIIAIVNTVLTALGLWVLGIEGKMAFLSAIVFFCSFIPVAGVFISSAPICLLALEQGEGVSLMLLAALLIWMIHLIEAYILNPRIYGKHLRINPVIVLIILTIAGKLVGVWGLVLGLPICTYFFSHAIWRGIERPAIPRG